MVLKVVVRSRPESAARRRSSVIFTRAVSVLCLGESHIGNVQRDYCYKGGLLEYNYPLKNFADKW